MWARVWEVRRQLVGVRSISPPRGLLGSNSVIRLGSKRGSPLSISLVHCRFVLTCKPKIYWAERANKRLRQTEAETRPQNPQHAQTCGRGARPRRRTRPRQPRAASRAPKVPPPRDAKQGAERHRPRPAPSDWSERCHHVAGSWQGVCVCMCVGFALSFVPRLTRPVRLHARLPAEGAAAALQGRPLT